MTKTPPMKGGSNRWATMSRAGAAKRTTKPAKARRVLDDYETPADATQALRPFLSLSGKLLEPAAGSGRMVRALKGMFPALKVESADIKRGNDFLRRTAPFKGHIFTNPPYRDGQAEAFARHALKLASGKVGMLMQSGFVWGARRANGIYLAGLKPELIVVIPWRIMFTVGSYGRNARSARRTESRESNGPTIRNSPMRSRREDGRGTPAVRPVRVCGRVHGRL